MSFAWSRKMEDYRSSVLRSWGMTARCATADPAGGGPPTRPSMAALDKPNLDEGKLQPGQRMPSERSKKGSGDRKKRGERGGARSKKKKRPAQNMMPFDAVGNSSRTVTQELLEISDGLAIQAVQSVCDNSNQMLGKEGDSYFMVRHALNFDGPHSFMMTNGQRAYTAGVDVQDKKSGNLMSANWQGPMLEGAWEKTWNRYLKTRADFVVSNSKVPQMMAMFPQYNLTVDCGTPTRAARVRVDHAGATGISLMNKLSQNLSLGAKVDANFAARTTELQIAAKYTTPRKGGGIESLEGSWNVTNGRYSVWYTKSLNYHSHLTARLQMIPSMKKAMGAFGYRYVFGSRQMGTSVTGEISSAMEFKAAVQVPLVQNIMLRCHGSMNHAGVDMQRGIFPHRFGLSLMVQV